MEEMNTRPWQQGQWGKGLAVDGQVHTWHTGTRSLNGGSPHHRQVAVGQLGMDDKTFFDGIKDRSVRLLQIDPDGRATDCFGGDKLPDWVHQQLGTQEPDPHDWKFGNAEDPYYNPEFDIPEWDEKYEQEAIHRMQNPPNNPTIQYLVRQGIPKGKEGKGLQFEDGTEARWIPDEFGSPHHDDVAKALGKHRMDRQYMHVDATGRMYDLFNDPQNDWKF